MIYIGDYFLGHERVSLFADTSSEGGSFSFFSDQSPKVHPKDSKHGRIIVGFACTGRWREVLEVLLHEVHEYALTRIGARLVSCDKDNVDNAAYVFHATHAQFTQAIQWASWFLCPAMPDLCDAWKKWHKKKTKRK